MTRADANYKSGITLTKDTPYLALTDELLGVFCVDSEQNWPWYNGTTLYFLCVEDNEDAIIMH